MLVNRVFYLTLTLIIAMLFKNNNSLAQDDYQEDIIVATTGDIKITFIGHGTLMLTFKNKAIHVDPVSKEGDYTKLPKADIVLITHQHYDHLDTNAVAACSRASTHVIAPAICSALDDFTVMRNGDVLTIEGITIDAVPAYNIVHERAKGKPFHLKGEGNGYIVTFGDKKVYIAGDTENIPEMKALKNIDIAFLPMNLPYTMTVEMVADAAKTFQPKILYPYHYGDTDPSKLVDLLKDTPQIEVRIRNMQ